MSLKTAAAADATGVTVAVVADLTHQCPHVDETDHGHVTVAWRVTDTTVELHSLAAYLRSFVDVRISHEAITACLADAVAAAGVTDVAITTTWTTAGMPVTVTASRPTTTKGAP